MRQLVLCLFACLLALPAVAGDAAHGYVCDPAAKSVTALTPVVAADTLLADALPVSKLSLDGGAPVYAQTCCKTCRKGKACGNSCIARWKTCHKGVGCACDAE
jgi:hypothetical protein